MTGLSLLFAIPMSPITLGIILILALVLFGNRLPSMMRSLGRSVVEFKKGVAGIEDDISDAVKKTDTKPSDNNSDNSSEV
ncbi:MAG: twin-arginine translocase TatA/TatE family subunit [Planctomycetaceae bacterium]|jgi:sec-independent protein translocase protein TatA|nr:twin-arginine translocase TatA/TatE family subunit [Planctomycetaceae bacterium]